LAYLLTSTVDAHFSEGLRGDQVPEATVERLLIALLPLYHAAVASLEDPETTLAALALMRSLIEAWTHLYFMMEPDSPSERSCRAIRLELGWAKDMAGLARSAEEEMPGQLSVALRREQGIEELRAKRGCKGGARTYGHVDQEVTRMAKKFGIDWLPGSWRSASQMTHVAGWDWMLVDQGDGTSSFGHPSPSHRAARLNHLVVLFSNVSQTALVILGVGLDSAGSRGIHEAAMAILDDPFLRRAIEGDYD
jgi:hypothetical protein